MFIQVIQGMCSREEELHELADEWLRDLAPESVGWLGGTYGVTDDGMFIGVVRFQSREAALANSARPEQARWAARLAALCDGPLEFHDCDDVTLMLDGGSDSAGFVQVIRGKVDDPSRLKAMMADTTLLHELRPDIVGASLAIEPDGTFTETVAFTDEASARAGEAQEPPAQIQEELAYAMKGATFFDLHHPWFASPR
ncbi:hypothetical protein [Nocardioides limicola]|uniref:hypothetical protein n=1 Tax=Nocardioides limicola TaxID=2803368 RepID=UPI00193C6ACE|nr:hypothetical protein [Nocardioides sp. DJM-14]